MYSCRLSSAIRPRLFPESFELRHSTRIPILNRIPLTRRDATLTNPERGSVTRNNVPDAKVLRVTDPRSAKSFRGSIRDIRFRGNLSTTGGEIASNQDF